MIDQLLSFCPPSQTKVALPVKFNVQPGGILEHNCPRALARTDGFSKPRLLFATENQSVKIAQ
jgi:hypothetical protein